MITIQEGKALRDVCTFGIGGPARYFIEVHTIDEAVQALAFASQRNVPFHILGKGSNSLFDDRGYNGVIIFNKINDFSELQPGRFKVGGGYNFSLLGVQTARQGWAGLEFASGIPASVGGAIYMNAGANGSETADTLESVDFLDAEGIMHQFPRQALTFAYRSSPFQQMSGIITGAIFKLNSQREARKKQLEIVDYRKKTQPYGEKSAGCVFRNPGESPAGALIDRAGLKGMRIGGARVSEKHANFIVNTGDATCEDVEELAAHVKEQVKTHLGVDLETEIRRIPYDPIH